MATKAETEAITLRMGGRTLEARLTCDHAASSHGLPVLVLDDGSAHGPADLPGWKAVSPTDAQRRELLRAGFAAMLEPEVRR